MKMPRIKTARPSNRATRGEMVELSVISAFYLSADMINVALASPLGESFETLELSKKLCLWAEKQAATLATSQRP